jgi:hypothetical protein
MIGSEVEKNPRIIVKRKCPEELMSLPRKLTGAMSLLEDEAFQPVARRRSERESSNANVDFIEPVKAEGVTLNISDGGMRVAVYQEIPADQDCIIKIWLTDNHHVCRRARIVWSKAVADGWVLGLEFAGEGETDDPSGAVKFSPIITCDSE